MAKYRTGSFPKITPSKETCELVWCRMGHTTLLFDLGFISSGVWVHNHKPSQYQLLVEIIGYRHSARGKWDSGIHKAGWLVTVKQHSLGELISHLDFILTPYSWYVCPGRQGEDLMSEKHRGLNSFYGLTEIKDPPAIWVDSRDYPDLWDSLMQAYLEGLRSVEEEHEKAKERLSEQLDRLLADCTSQIQGHMNICENVINYAIPP